MNTSDISPSSSSSDDNSEEDNCQHTVECETVLCMSPTGSNVVTPSRPDNLTQSSTQIGLRTPTSSNRGSNVDIDETCDINLVEEGDNINNMRKKEEFIPSHMMT